MKIYGYSRDGDTLMEMESVSLQFSSEDLRRVSDFLIWAADEMEKHGDRFGHEHYKDFSGERDIPVDIIVSS